MTMGAIPYLSAPDSSATYGPPLACRTRVRRMNGLVLDLDTGFRAGAVTHLRAPTESARIRVVTPAA